MAHLVCPTSLPLMNLTRAHSIVPTETHLNIATELHSSHSSEAHAMSSAQAESKSPSQAHSMNPSQAHCGKISKQITRAQKTAFLRKMGAVWFLLLFYYSHAQGKIDSGMKDVRPEQGVVPRSDGSASRICARKWARLCRKRDLE